MAGVARSDQRSTNSSSAPLISVIVCTYNRHATLRRALDSVFHQTVQDFEVIVVDDGSTPPVALPSEPPRRLWLVTSDHRGVGSARAQGLEAARGRFVAYCDDDDEWDPDHLAELLGYLLDHPDVDLVYADSRWSEPGTEGYIPYSI